MPPLLDVAFGGALLLATWAAVNSWYLEVMWVDEVVHFLTLAAVAPTAHVALAVLGMLPAPGDRTIRFRHVSVPLLTTALGLAAAAVWEMYQWVANQLSRHYLGVGYTDTVVDLALGGLGALFAGIALAAFAPTPTGRPAHRGRDGTRLRRT